MYSPMLRRLPRELNDHVRDAVGSHHWELKSTLLKYDRFQAYCERRCLTFPSHIFRYTFNRATALVESQWYTMLRQPRMYKWPSDEYLHCVPLLLAYAAHAGNVHALSTIYIDTIFFDWDLYSWYSGSHINSIYTTELLFVLRDCALLHGHCDVLQWLMYRFPHSGLCDNLYIEAVRRGRLCVIKWLDAKKYGPDEYCFICAAQCGHLHLLQYYYAEGYIFADPHLLHTRAAVHNHKRVCQWLKDVGLVRDVVDPASECDTKS